MIERKHWLINLDNKSSDRDIILSVCIKLFNTQLSLYGFFIKVT